jgi:hypothetical protein
MVFKTPSRKPPRYLSRGAGFSGANQSESTPRRKNKMKIKISTQDTVTLDDAFEQIDARRRAENPWTDADEKRYAARSAADRATQEAWAIANPAADEDEEDDEDDADC